MYGSSIEQARQTLSLCISSLPLGMPPNPTPKPETLLWYLHFLDCIIDSLLCLSPPPFPIWAGARFNILGFGSHWVSLFPSPRPFDDETKALALTHCDTIQADLGGKEKGR